MHGYGPVPDTYPDFSGFFTSSEIDRLLTSMVTCAVGTVHKNEFIDDFYKEYMK